MHTVLPLALGKTFFFFSFWACLIVAFFFPSRVSVGSKPPHSFCSSGLMPWWLSVLSSVPKENSTSHTHDLMTIKHDIASFIHHLCISAFQSSQPAREWVLASWRKCLWTRQVLEGHRGSGSHGFYARFLCCCCFSIPRAHWSLLHSR